MLTFAAALVVVCLCILGFILLGAPVYRVEAANVKALLALLLADKATQSDWDVFSGMPIRNDARLDAIRLRCREIVAREAFVKRGKLRLSSRGKEEIGALLRALEQQFPAPAGRRGGQQQEQQEQQERP